MGNKSLSSPLPSYETAVAYLAETEVAHLRGAFGAMSRNRAVVTLQGFIDHSKCAAYPKKHILPRLFAIMDTKKDGVLDFEEFISTVALFRVGNTEEKIKMVFLMYEPNMRTGFLMREQLRLLLIDALVLAQREDSTMPLNVTEDWIESQLELSLGMVDMVLCEHCTRSGSASGSADVSKQHEEGIFSSFNAQSCKLELAEFINFVALEGSIQGLLSFLPTIVDF